MPSSYTSRKKAQPLVMWGGPRSPEATALVEHLLRTTILPANAKVDEDGVVSEVRPTSASALRRATGALLADLFDFHRGASSTSRPLQCYHGMSRSNFSKQDLGFGYDVFRAVIGPLMTEGLLTSTPGSVVWTRREGRWAVIGSSKTCFGLTEAMVALAAGRGVPLTDWGTHWTRFSDGREHPTSLAPRLILREERKRERGRKASAKDHPYDATAPVPQALLSGVERLNEYLRGLRISGLAFAGLRRIFSNGDTDGTDWNKGGRFYSLPGGHRYEAWDAQRRCESIRLNGEEVVEVDLRASHLTLLHGLLGLPFDANQDPYDIADWPRAVVKAWVSKALGSSNPIPLSWSEDAEDEFEAERSGRWMDEEFPIKEVSVAVIARHPVLRNLRTCGIGTLDLQYHEAEILRLAMETLMLERDIPVLPIHDALIVPRSQATTAVELLQAAFLDRVEEMTEHPSLAIPMVTLKAEG